MANPATLSIVTPSFQQAAFLQQTMESVLSQKINGLEYLVIDGGSTDGSLEIIKKYKNRLAYWVTEADHGQADAINKGLKRVKGEIVAWINSDDYYMPDTFSFVLDFFKQNPDTGLVYGDLLAVDENNKLINLIRYQNWGQKGLSHFQIIGQPSVFFRKTVLEQVGYLDPSLHFLLDHQLWLRMAAVTRIQYLPKTLAAARYHPLAKNINYAPVFGEDAFRVVNWMKTDPKYQEIWQKDQRNIMASANRLYGFYLAEGELWQNALNAYLESFKLNPLYLIKDWRRFLFTFLNFLGLTSFVKLARTFRNRKRQENLLSERVK